MSDSRKPKTLLEQIHRLVRGPARETLERACREWLQCRRRAIAEAPPWPEWRGDTRESLMQCLALCEAREDRFPELPWPLDGREVSFAAYCAVLAVYHDAKCARCERCPLFPMPQGSGAPYDGVSWKLLRDAVVGNPDAEAMEDALEAVRAELRRRGVLPDESSEAPTTTPSGAQGGVVGETTFLDKLTRDIAKATAVVVGKKNTAGVSRLLEIAHSDETVDRRLYLMNQTRLLRADVSARELASILECSPTAVKRTRWWKARMTQRKQEKANAEAAYHSRRGARGGKHRR